MKARFLKSIIVLAAVIGISGCGKAPVEEKAEIVENVKALEIQPKDLVEELSLSGWVEAIEDIKLSAELGGRVEWIGVEEGQKVEKDQLLAKVNIEVLQAVLRQAEAQFDLARLNHERQQQLFKKKLISPGQMDRYVADFKVAEAALETARVRFGKGQLSSPIDGTLDRMDLDVGEVLLPGQAVGRIVDTSRVEVHVSLPEKDVVDIRVGDRVAVRVISSPHSIYQGDVFFVAVAAEGVSKTFPAKILIDNARGGLRPGMIARVTFQKPPRDGCLAVPQKAVLSEEGRKWVYLVREGRAVEREIRIGVMVGNEVEVLEGLEPGDLVVTMGQHNLLDGDAVRIVSGGSPSGEDPR